jgi:putative membrane protein
MNIGQLVINSLVFSTVGIAVLFVAYFIVEKITPENTWKKISQENNVAVALVFAALIIGISMIISAAIHG